MTYKFDENAGTNGEWLKHYKIYDHIGNVRAVVKDEGTGNYSIISQMDYEPFGAVLSQIGGSDRQTFIGKEKDNESSLGDFGVRKYDDFAGRFFQIDPMWEKYYGWTPYHYSANNPVSFLDPGGMDAWEINNQWNEDFEEKYMSFIGTQIDKYKKEGKVFTCEDLALSLLIDFASINKLPLTIVNASGVYSASSDDYFDKNSFMNDVLATTAANDLQRQENTTLFDISEAKSGDMLLLRRDGKTANHVQVVRWSVGETIAVNQGNLGLGNSNPSSIFYGGQEIESGSYSSFSGAYVNFTTNRYAQDFINSQSIILRRWNFNKW